MIRILPPRYITYPETTTISGEHLHDPPIRASQRLPEHHAQWGEMTRDGATTARSSMLWPMYQYNPF